MGKFFLPSARARCSDCLWPDPSSAASVGRTACLGGLNVFVEVKAAKPEAEASNDVAEGLLLTRFRLLALGRYIRCFLQFLLLFSRPASRRVAAALTSYLFFSVRWQQL